MKNQIVLSLIASLAIVACAPKHAKLETRGTVAPAKSSAPAAPSSATQFKTDAKVVVEASKVESPKVESQKVEAQKTQAPKVDAPKAATPAPVVRADGKPEIFGNDFTCTEEFPARFAPFQKNFADAAKALDQSLIAMKVVTDRLEDSGGHHAKVKGNFAELTKAFQAMRKEFGTTFGCFYLLPRGNKVTITSDTFMAEYKALLERTQTLIGEQNLGQTIKD